MAKYLEVHSNMIDINVPDNRPFVVNLDVLNAFGPDEQGSGCWLHLPGMPRPYYIYESYEDIKKAISEK